MQIKMGCAAVIAAFLLSSPVVAQDVTLTSLDGALTVEGTLQGFDGEFYRVASSYGMLTVDGQSVICTGPGCPDLTAPFALVSVSGAAEAGQRLLPALLRRYAQARGFTVVQRAVTDGFVMEIADPATDKPLAKISFSAASPADARAALADGRVDMIVASRPEAAAGERVMGLDAMVPIVAADSKVAKISTTDLARALSGEVQNWAEIGGPDMPLVLHALRADSSLQEALDARLGRPVQAKVTHDSEAALAAAVARDPWALAISVQTAIGAARGLPLTDSCGFPLPPTRLAVKAEDYPLALPVYLLTPRRRLPLFVREFMGFLGRPEAQAAIAEAGYIDRAPERQTLTADGVRLINAIRGAGDDVPMGELKRVAEAMAGAERISLTFRFEDGAATLDAPSRENLRDLAELLAVGAYKGEHLVLAGFSDGSGDAAANLDLSRDRAQTVADALAGLATDLPDGQALPVVEAFGEALPMACDTTTGGRRLNRRVELWARPAIGSGSP